MKSIFAKTNPDFKRAQPLPVVQSLRPPSAACAARRFSESKPLHQERPSCVITFAISATPTQNANPRRQSDL
jgi:hypothetical protein